MSTTESTTAAPKKGITAIASELRTRFTNLVKKLGPKASNATVRSQLKELEARIVTVEAWPNAASSKDIEEIRKGLKTLEDLAETVAKHTTDIAQLREELDAANANIEVLIQVPTKTASARATAARFAVIETRLDKYEAAREQMADGSLAADAIDKAVANLRKEVSEANDFLVEEIVRVEGMVNELGGVVNGHADILDDHTLQIEMLNEGQQSLNQRVGNNTNPTGPIIIGLLVGFGAWYAWLAHTFTGAPAANNPWAAVLAGAAVYGLVFGLTYAAWPSRRTTNNAEDEPVHQDQPVTTQAQEGANHHV